MGNNIVQQYDISWSNLILGKEALTHMNVKIAKQVFNPNIRPQLKPCKVVVNKLLFSKLFPNNRSTRESEVTKSKYPPKNRILVKIQINTILAYSAKKKNTKMAAECSVIKPETNSDSASAKSKGALLVSAIAPIKNIKAIGNRGNK